MGDTQQIVHEEFRLGRFSKPGQQRIGIAERVQHEVWPGDAVEMIWLAPTSVPDSSHTGLLARLDVETKVANNGDVARREAPRVANCPDRRGIGLHRSVLTSHDRIEVKLQPPECVQRYLATVAGQNGAAQTALCNRVEKRPYTRHQCGPRCTVPFVALENLFALLQARLIHLRHTLQHRLA